MDTLEQAVRDALGDCYDTYPAQIVVARYFAGMTEVLAAGQTSENEKSIPGAKFLIYSLTKSFIAAVALRLVTAGELALDAPIMRWLPRFPNADRITLRQLLQHTSGLPDYGPLQEYHEAVRRGDTPWTPEEFLCKTKVNQLRSEPGQQFSYSNVGYMLLGHLMESVRACSLAEILKNEIFEPLRLEQVFLVGSRADLGSVLLGPSPYLGSKEQPLNTYEHYDPRWVATGVIAASANEIIRFYQALFTGILLPELLLQEMMRPIMVAPMPNRPWRKPGYGLGLQVDSGYPIGNIYGHTGGGPGSSACACTVYRGDLPLTVVVFSNDENVALVEEIAIRALGITD